MNFNYDELKPKYEYDDLILDYDEQLEQLLSPENAASFKNVYQTYNSSNYFHVGPRGFLLKLVEDIYYILKYYDEDIKELDTKYNGFLVQSQALRKQSLCEQAFKYFPLSQMTSRVQNCKTYNNSSYFHVGPRYDLLGAVYNLFSMFGTNYPYYSINFVGIPPFAKQVPNQTGSNYFFDQFDQNSNNQNEQPQSGQREQPNDNQKEQRQDKNDNKSNKASAEEQFQCTYVNLLERLFVLSEDFKLKLMDEKEFLLNMISLVRDYKEDWGDNIMEEIVSKVIKDESLKGSKVFKKSLVFLHPDKNRDIEDQEAQLLFVEISKIITQYTK